MLVGQIGEHMPFRVNYISQYQTLNLQTNDEKNINSTARRCRHCGIRRTAELHV